MIPAKGGARTNNDPSIYICMLISGKKELLTDNDLQSFSLVAIFFAKQYFTVLCCRCGKPNVKLETEAGEVFYADHVICTMPLGAFSSY